MSETEAQEEHDEGSMTLFEHLDELRRRLISSVIVVALTTFVCFGFSKEIFSLLRLPLSRLSEQQLIVLSPLEMFITYLKLSILAGIFISAPWLLYQVWQFVAPGLYQNEKKWVVPFVFLGTVFFAAGGYFAFEIVMPYGFEYLVKMQPDFVDAQYSVAIYFGLVIKLLLAFGVVFELPLAMWILSAAGIVAPKTYSKFRKYWVVIAVVVAAFLTPPDPLTQGMMAIPLIFFFELGILGARVLYPSRAKQKKAQDA